MEKMPALTRPRVRPRVATLLLLLLIVACGNEWEKVLASGRQYVSRGEYRAAAIQLKSVLQQKPRHPEARYLLGICELKLSDFSSAENELRKANELGYSADMAVPALALALAGQGKWKQLVSELGNTQLSDPKAVAELQTRLGEAYVGVGSLAQAQDAFARALDAKADYPPALVGQSKMFAATGNVTKALHAIDDVLDKWPQEAEALTFKASLARSQGEVEEAAAYMRQVVQIQPGNVVPAFLFISLLLERGDLNEASRQIESVKKFAANDPRIAYLQGLLAFKQRNFVAARDFVLQVLKVSPDHLPSLVLAGAANYELNAQRQAQDYLQKVLAQTPQALYVRRLLIDSYLRSGDISAASRLLDQSRKELANDTGLRILAAEVAVANGDLDAAAGLYKQAGKDASSGAVAATRLGEIEFAKGNAQGAVQILEAASAADNQRTESDAMLAIYFAAHGQGDKALAWVDSIEKKQPQGPLPPTLRGSIYLRNKAYSAARAQFERALLLRDNFIPALEGLARVDVAENKPEAARKRFEEQFNKEPGNAVLALRYARFLQGFGVPKAEVIDVLQRAVKSQPAVLETRVPLISLYLELGDAAQALAAAQDGLVTSPESRELLALIGRAQLAAGKRNAAIATYEKLVSLEPNAFAPLLMLADAHIANHDRLNAIAALRRALALQGDLAEAQVRLLQLYLADGQTREALAVARDMQRRRPNQAVGYRAEGEVLLKTRDYDQAAKVLEKGFKLTSSWVLVPPLHKVLVKLGRQSEADALVKKWLDGNPKDANVRTYLAQRAMESKNYELAARLFKEILSLEPNAGAALNNLAWVAGEMHDPRALEYAERANQLLPNAPPVMDTLGWLLVEGGKASRGVELLQKAVELAPQLDGIRFHLAKGLIQTNRKDSARKELEYLDSHLDDAQAKAEVEALLREL